jgi:hypothetical protein
MRYCWRDLLIEMMLIREDCMAGSVNTAEVDPGDNGWVELWGYWLGQCLFLKGRILARLIGDCALWRGKNIGFVVQGVSSSFRWSTDCSSEFCPW